MKTLNTLSSLTVCATSAALFAGIKNQRARAGVRVDKPWSMLIGRPTKSSLPHLLFVFFACRGMLSAGENFAWQATPRSQEQRACLSVRWIQGVDALDHQDPAIDHFNWDPYIIHLNIALFVWWFPFLWKQPCFKCAKCIF